MVVKKKNFYNKNENTQEFVKGRAIKNLKKL